jgi:hypothetical protein
VRPGNSGQRCAEDRVLVTLRTRAPGSRRTLSSGTRRIRHARVPSCRRCISMDTSSIHPDTDVPQVRGLAVRRAELAALAS